MARILLAEDDIAVRDFIRRALEMDGHRVTPVHDSGDAMLRLAWLEEPYDLLFADVGLPLMDGISLARYAREHRPGLAVVITSGDLAKCEQARLRVDVIRAVIAKPFTIRQLQEAVNDALAPAAISQNSA